MDGVREPDDLYGLPLDEFTAARNDLALSLKAQGRADEANRVKKLKKPPVSAWAVNQLARAEPDAIARLLALVDELKEARSAEDIHRLGARRRELVAKLTRRAGELAEAAGHAASATTLQRVTQTLQAGAEDEERGLLQRGALPDDLGPAGFDALGALASSDAFTPAPGPEEDDAERDELERLAKEAEEEAARLGEEAERAEAAALAASEAASEARRRARAARHEAQKATRSR